MRVKVKGREGKDVDSVGGRKVIVISDDDNEPEFASQQLPPQEAQEGQQSDRGPWLHPVVPGPHHEPLPNDGDG